MLVIFFMRLLQKTLFVISKLLPWREPEVISGENSLPLLKDRLLSLPYRNYLIVTDQGIVKAGLLKHVLLRLNDPTISFVVFDETVPNPTIDNVEHAAAMYLKHGCDALIGLGGGSAIDAAKCVGIRIAKPKASFSKMRGILKVNKTIPYLVAIPTTAGTGSETTIAAVISDPKTHEKFAISDLHLMPKIAVLDPLLTENLPPFFTATTGMDALTHAVEAFIGKAGTKSTHQRAIQAVRTIHKYLLRSYQHPHDLEARLFMLLASYDAGFAFTRAYVGNIHAMAHTFGGFHQIPHGYANAILMPHVLRYYGSSIQKKLATLSDAIGLMDRQAAEKEKSDAFIGWIETLNRWFDLPDFIAIQDKAHISNMIVHAHREANPLYPVPVIFSKKDFEVLYLRVMKTTS